MSAFTVIYDACVLYPDPLRDLLMRLAMTGLFRARWTEEIHDEWTRNLRKNRPDLDPANIARTRERMDLHNPGCLVKGYEAHIPTLILPDPGDRHVVAAAIHARAAIIVTWNLKHFPAAALSRHDLEAQDPDTFIENQCGLDTDAVVEAAAKMRAAFVRKPIDPDQYLAMLERQGLRRSTAILRQHRDRI